MRPKIDADRGISDVGESNYVSCSRVEIARREIKTAVAIYESEIRITNACIFAKCPFWSAKFYKR